MEALRQSMKKVPEKKPLPHRERHERKPDILA
jgi:hypothetical protein